MRKRYAMIAIGMALGIGFAHGVQAESTKPIQLALFSPAQIFAPETSIKGIRLNLIYGKNKNMTGLDVGIGCHTTGNFSGLQYGIVGYVEGKAVGWQDNAVNIAKEFSGVQTGLYNGSDNAYGFLWGLVNKTESMRGFQLGLLNITENMDGLQIGLLNIIQKKPSLPILPIINWQF